MMDSNEEVPLETLLEATMFGAGRSMSVTELCESLGYDEEEMLDSLSALQATLRRRRYGALQLSEIGQMWALEVKPSITQLLPKDVKTDLPQKLLKAASLIAYHQPIAQSRLVEMLGPKAYDYVRELAQAGMVDRRKDGSTRRLTTTRRFAELFGCPETDKKKVRDWFRAQVKSSGILDLIEQEHLILQEHEEDGVED
jgi:segregation and condensation protein B